MERVAWVQVLSNGAGVARKRNVWSRVRLRSVSIASGRVPCTLPGHDSGTSVGGQSSHVARRDIAGSVEAYNALCIYVWEIAMHKRMTITLDEAVYEGLYRTVGKRRMSQFIEDLLRPHVLGTSLDEGYRAMAADQAREAEAHAWCNALAGDVADAAR